MQRTLKIFPNGHQLQQWMRSECDRLMTVSSFTRYAQDRRIVLEGGSEIICRVVATAADVSYFRGMAATVDTTEHPDLSPGLQELLRGTVRPVTYVCPKDGVPKPERRHHARGAPDERIDQLFNGFHNLLDNVASRERDPYWNGYVMAMRQKFADLVRSLRASSAPVPLTGIPAQDQAAFLKWRKEHPNWNGGPQ